MVLHKYFSQLHDFNDTRFETSGSQCYDLHITCILTKKWVQIPTPITILIFLGCYNFISDYSKKFIIYYLFYDGSTFFLFQPNFLLCLSFFLEFSASGCLLEAAFRACWS